MFKSVQISLIDSFNYFRSAVHLGSIDLLRGVASLSVMFYHLVLGRFDQLPWLQWLTSYGHFGVQVFFVISGFVIPYSMYISDYRLRHIGKFIVKRLARLEPPYLIAVLICFILVYYQLYNPYNGGPFIPITWQQVVLHAGYLNTFFDYKWFDSAFWTLAIEFQYYILMALIFPLIRGKIAIIIFWLAGVACALLITDHTLFFLHFPFFFLGITLFLLKSHGISFKEFILFVLATVVMIGFINDLLHAACGLITLLVMITGKGRNKIWIFFGGISYSLYLLHDPIGQTILNFITRYTSNEWVMFIAIWLCMILLVIVAWFYKIKIEDPSVILSRKIKY